MPSLMYRLWVLDLMLELESPGGSWVKCEPNELASARSRTSQADMVLVIVIEVASYNGSTEPPLAPCRAI